MSNDLIRLAMERAAEKFGNKGDGIFNAANFSATFKELAGTRGALDGEVVRAMLTGRGDVVVLSGGAHYQLLYINKEPRVLADSWWEKEAKNTRNALRMCRDWILKYGLKSDDGGGLSLKTAALDAAKAELGD